MSSSESGPDTSGEDGRKPGAAKNGSSEQGALDVIVRLHDPRLPPDLKRCIYSLVCQDYRPTTIHLVTQRFAPADVVGIKAALAPTLALAPEVGFKVWNYDKAAPKDARSALINLGIYRARGRYLTFLDFDDFVYPEAYTALIDELAAGPHAIAFGGIAMRYLDVFEDAMIVDSKTTPFRGTGLLDLFRDNFCPIHSFVVDRQRVDPVDLYFDLRLSRLEDYEFLMRICARYPASFALSGRIIGDYCYKKDGSNTTPMFAAVTEERISEWEWSRALLEERRREILVSPEVQASLGIRPPEPKLTIRALIGPKSDMRAAGRRWGLRRGRAWRRMASALVGQR